MARPWPGLEAVGRSWDELDAVTLWMLPANAAAAAALWIWITRGLEGNILAFAFGPALGLATLCWFYWLGRCPRPPAKP